MSGRRLSLYSLLIVTWALPAAAQQTSDDPKPIGVRASMPTAFAFHDYSETVIARGTVWVALNPNGSPKSWGPGAVVECSSVQGTCLLTQFYDAGHSSTKTTYKISRWDAERVEAEDGTVNIADKYLSDGSRKQLAIECVILDRRTQQVFVVQKRAGQGCRQVEPGTAGPALPSGYQLCARSGGTYECPHMVRKD